jgi:hypothetical protein
MWVLYTPVCGIVFYTNSETLCTITGSLRVFCTLKQKYVIICHNDLIETNYIKKFKKNYKSCTNKLLYMHSKVSKL